MYNKKFPTFCLCVVLAASMLTGCSLIPMRDTTENTSNGSTDASVNNSTESDGNLLYTTSDNVITLALPDKEWFNIADADSRRTFIRDDVGILTIDHNTGGYADVKTIPTSETEVNSLLNSKAAATGDAETAGDTYTLVTTEFKASEVAESYYYEVSYPEGNKVRYEIVWGMQAPEEVYEAVARSYTADESIISTLRNSVKSIQVLGGSYDGLVRTSGAIDAASTLTKKNQYKCIQSANVRDAATNNSNVIGEVSEGETIDVLNTTGNWLEFKYEGQTAYVYGKFFEAVSGGAASANEGE